MRNKSLILLLACVCGTIAAVGISQWMQARGTTGEAAPKFDIFVAAKAIDIGEQVTAEMIRLEPWPADRIPEGAVGDLALLDGKYARQKFYAGEPVMPVKLMDTNTATAPKGYSVVAMRADAENSISNLVQPGDRVNVMAFFTKSELIPRTMTKTVLSGVRIFAIDGNTDRQEDDAKPTTARTIQLAIRSEDVDAWTYANELGKIRLSLGNPGDYEEPSSEGGPSKAGKDFLKWLADHQAAQDRRREEKVEPVVPTSTPVAVAAPKKPKEGFKMLKMVEGRMIEYWIAPNSVPVVMSDSGATGGVAGESTDAESTSSATATQSDEGAAGKRSTVSPGDYSHLNGADSPFFEPNEERTTPSSGY
ncbi:SAF domain protein [Novipirellula galeiformis]|uniref:SAF domain protein n=1 Tax=Novipirellula galeiformis TaxID=2528004 RepID=A0A5C6CIG4_9BACT|nr:Flp pilus assembly protein CpaB [Novipirellula galeiformis]TWU23151.1 SAF domain protein [Novipirellula galeiformis]